MTISTRARLQQLFVTVGAVTAVAGCGGGGSPAPSPAGVPVASAPAPIPAPAPTPAPAPPPPTSLEAARPTAADCPRLLSESTARAELKLDTPLKQQLSTLLQDTSPTHGYKEFIRLPSLIAAWVEDAGSRGVDMFTVGTALHETNHDIDFTLTYKWACS